MAITRKTIKEAWQGLTKSEPVPQAPLLSIMPLEDRIVLDGGLVGEALSLGFDTVAPTPFTNVALIASDAPDIQGIKSAFAASNTQVIVIDAQASQSDILNQLAQISADGRAPIASISLFSHARAGSFQLGETAVSNDNVGELNNIWQAIDLALMDGGSFNIYGCNLAEDRSGQQLVNDIAIQTNAQVYASNDITGQSGDWVLEISSQGARAFDVNNTAVDEAVLSQLQGDLLVITQVGADAAAPFATNQATVSLQGTAAVGQQFIVNIYSGIHITDPAAIQAVSDRQNGFAGGNGTWALTGNINLPDGAYTLFVNDAQNAATVLASTQFSIDTVPPVLAYATAASTGVTTPTITGTVTDPASTVTVTISELGAASQTLTATIDAVGNWTATPLTALIAGSSYNVSVTAIDAAGNSDSMLNNPLTVIQPAIQHILNPLGSTNVPTVSGTGDSRYSIRIDVLDGLGAIIASVDTPVTTNFAGASVWSHSFQNLVDGTYTIKATQIDPNNGFAVMSTAITGTMVLDQTALPPTLVTVQSAANIPATIIGGQAYINVASPVLVGAIGSVENGATITLTETTVGIVTIPVQVVTASLVNGSWTLALPVLNDGLHSFSIRQTDLLGNVSQPAALHFTVDTAVVGLNIAPLATSTISFPSISGTAEVSPDPLTNPHTVSVTVSQAATPIVTINNIVVDAAGNWSVSVPRTDPVSGAIIAPLNGVYSVTVSQIDALGNIATPVTQPLTVNTTVTPPSVNLTALVANPTLLQTPVLLNGIGIEGASIQITATNILTTVQSVIATIPLVLNGTWSLPNTGLAAALLADGNYTFSVVQIVDVVGSPLSTVFGTSAAIASISSLQIDTQVILPVVATINNVAVVGASHGTNSNILSATITVETNASANIVLTDNAGLVVDQRTLSALVATPTSISYVAPQNIVDGTYTLAITQTDAAGNQSQASSIALTVDSVALAPIVNALEISTTGVVVDPATQVKYINATSGFLTFSGTAEPGATVSISNLTVPAIGGVGVTPLIVPSVVANVAGAWTVAIATPLAQGAQTASIVQTDILNNISQATALNFVVDTAVVGFTLPAIPAQASSFPVISGTGEDGGSVTVTVSGVAPMIPLTLTAGSITQGGWSVTVPTNLANGNYTVTASFTDVAQNTSVAGPVTMTIAAVVDPPSLNIVPVTKSGTLDPAVINGVGIVGSAVNIIVTDAATGLAAGNYVLTVAANGAATTNTWSLANTLLVNGFNVPLADGAYQVSVTQTTNAANAANAGGVVGTSAATISNVILDNISVIAIVATIDAALPPAVNAAGAIEFITNNTQPSIIFNIEVGATLNLTLDGLVLASLTDIGNTGNVTFTPNAPLTAVHIAPATFEQHTLVVSQTDIAGNIGPASTVLINVDTQVDPVTATPVGTLFGVTQVVNSAQMTNFTLSGTGEVGATVTITGINVLSIVGVVTPMAPAVVNVIADVNGVGVWTHTFAFGTQLAEGIQTATITQQDSVPYAKLGVQNAPISTTLNFNVDTTVTPLTIDTLGTLVAPAVISLTNRPLIQGTAEANRNAALATNVTVQVFSIAAPLVPIATFNPIADSLTGQWSVTNVDYAASLVNGSYSATVTQTDEAGNTLTTSQLFSVASVVNAPIFDAAMPNAASPSLALTPVISGTADIHAAQIHVSAVAVADALGTPQVGAVPIVLANALTNPITVNGTQWILVNTNPALIALADGFYQISVTQVLPDGVGATLVGSSIASTQVLQIDTVAAPFSIVTDLVTFNVESLISYPVVSGTAEVPPAGTTATVDLVITSKLPVGAPVGTLPAITVNLTANVDNLGNWTASVPGLQPLTNGLYDVSLTQTDYLGNQATLLKTLNVNATVPAPTLTLPTSLTQLVGTANPLTSQTPLIQGDSGLPAAPLGSVINISLHSVAALTLNPLAPAAFVTTATVGDPLAVGANPTAWALSNQALVQALLADGQYQVTVTQTTSAGTGFNSVGTSAAVVGNVVIDTAAIAPLVATVDAVLPGLGNTVNTANPTPAIILTTEPGATVSITVNGVAQASILANNLGTVTFQPTLNAGSTAVANIITFRQTDEAGNTSPTVTTLTINVDNAALAPSATIDAAAMNLANPLALVTTIGTQTFINTATPILSGVAEAGASISITGLSPVPAVPVTVLAVTDAFGNTTWQATLPILAEGAQSLSIVQTDALGNISPATLLTFSVDTAVTNFIYNGIDPLTNTIPSTTSFPIISGTTEVAAGNTSYAVNVTLVSQVIVGQIPAVNIATIAAVNGNGAWQVDVSALVPAGLANGQYTLTATMTDVAQNTATIATILDVNKQVLAPVLNVPTTPVNPAGAGTAVILNGLATSAEPTSIINIDILLGAVIMQTHTTSADAAGAWSIPNAAIANPPLGTAILADGIYTVRVSQTTVAATSLVALATVIIDTVAQPVVINTIDGVIPALGATSVTSNILTPTVVLTIEPGSILNVTINGVITTNVATADLVTGAVTFTLPALTASALGSPNNITFTQTDIAGNTNVIGTSMTIVVDNATIGLSTNPVGTLLGASDVVGGAGGNQPILTGTGEAGATVNVQIFNVATNVLVSTLVPTLVLAPVTPGGAATWSALVPIALVDGAYTISVTQTDLAGNTTPVGLEVTRSFFVDTTVTPLSITSAITSTATSYPTLAGDAEFNRGAALSQVSISINNAPGNLTLAAPLTIPSIIVTQLGGGANLTGTWSTVVNTPLSNGTYTVTVTQTDELGNVATVVQTLTVNTTVVAPSLTLTPSDIVGGSTNPATQLTPLVAGTGIAGATIHLTATQTADALGNIIALANQVPVTLTPIVIGANGTWQMSTLAQQSGLGVLADGSYRISATQTTIGLLNPAIDPAAATHVVGTSVAVVQTFVIDKTAQAPVVDPIGQLFGGLTVANATPVISGSAEANATVQVSGLVGLTNVVLPTQTVVADALGVWQLTLLAPLQQGAQTANVVQTDILNNVSASTIVNFEVDSSVTNLTVVAGTQGTLNPVISGTAEIPRGAVAATVTVTVTDPLNLNAVVTTVPNIVVNSLNGTWTTQLTAFVAMGTFNVSATQMDELGNTATVVGTLTITALNPPVILFPSVTNLPPTALGTVSTVSGTADFNNPVQITFTQVDVIGNPLVPASVPVVLNTIADALGNWTLDNTTVATALGGGPGQYYQVSTIQGLGSANASAPDIQPNLMLVDTVAPAVALVTFNSIAAMPVESELFTIAVNGEIGTSTNVTLTPIGANPNVAPAVTFIIPELFADPLTVPPAAPIGLATSTVLQLLAGDYTMTTVLVDAAGNSSSVTSTLLIVPPQDNAINVVQAPNLADTNAVLFNDPAQLSGAPVFVTADGRVTGVSPTILNLHPAVNPLTGLPSNDAFNQISLALDPLTGLPISPSLKAGVNSTGINPVTGAASGLDPVTGFNVDTVITNNASPVISGQLPVAAVQTVDIFFKTVNPVTGVETIDFVVPVTTNALGQWTVDLAAQNLVLADGLHRIFASGIGIGGVSNTFDMVVDTVAPISPVILNIAPTAANGGIPQVAGTFDLIGTAEPGSRVIVQINPTFVVTADALGNWSIVGISLTPNTTFRMFIFSVDLATNTTMVTPFDFTVNRVGGIIINAPTTYLTDPSSPTVILAGTVVIDGLLENITAQAINNTLADIWAKSQQNGGLLESIRLAAINGLPVEPINQDRLNPDTGPADRIEDNGYLGYLRISAESPDLTASANETIDRTSKSRFRSALNHIQQAETTIGHGNRLTEGRIAMFAPEFQLGELSMNMNDAFAVLDDDAKLRLFAMDDRNVRINFDFDKYALKKQGINDMSVFTDWINREWGQWIGVWGSQHVHVVGHTDFIGTTEYNDSLGMRRAFVAGEYLVKHLGFAVEHISFDSWGKDLPIDEGKSDESRATNRRVEINIGDILPENVSPKFSAGEDVNKFAQIHRDFVNFLQTGSFGRFSK